MKTTTMMVTMAALLAGVAAPAQAAAGDFLVRLRVIDVIPNESGGGIQPAFPNEPVGVNNAVTGEVDFTYMATKNIGFELIAATTKHSIVGTTGTTGSIGKLADTWVLPPTLTVQYHFNADGHVRPYVGAGINYTIFYSSKPSAGLEAAVGPTHVGLSDSVNFAAQAGVDFDIGKNLFLNFDVKYIKLPTTAYVNTTAAGMQTVNVDIDPLVVGVGVGFRF
jgi:outer membrane protein